METEKNKGLIPQTPIANCLIGMTIFKKDLGQAVACVERDKDHRLKPTQIFPYYPAGALTFSLTPDKKGLVRCPKSLFCLHCK